MMSLSDHYAITVNLYGQSASARVQCNRWKLVEGLAHVLDKAIFSQHQFRWQSVFLAKSSQNKHNRGNKNKQHRRWLRPGSAFKIIDCRKIQFRVSLLVLHTKWIAWYTMSWWRHGNPYMTHGTFWLRHHDSPANASSSHPFDDDATCTPGHSTGQASGQSTARDRNRSGRGVVIDHVITGENRLLLIDKIWPPQLSEVCEWVWGWEATSLVVRLVA